MSFLLETGIYISSQAVSSQVLSAQLSLTSVFGMRTGGSSLLSSPQWLYKLLSAVYIRYDFFPLSKEKIILSIFGEFPFTAKKIDNCTAFQNITFGIRKLVEIIVFSPYFRIRIRLFSQFLEIKPSTY